MNPGPRPATSPAESSGAVRECRDGAAAHLVLPATAADGETIAVMLADAFAGYPFTDWTVPARDRGRRLRELFSLTLAGIGIPHGDTWVARCADAERAGELAGAVVALPPDGVPDEVWARVAPNEAALLGDRAETAARADEATQALRPSQAHYSIATLGVARHHRRRGLARRLLEPVLAEADGLGVPCYLETSTTGNVALYEGLGFTVVGAVALPDGGPTVWGMCRSC